MGNPGAVEADPVQVGRGDQVRTADLRFRTVFFVLFGTQGIETIVTVRRPGLER
jgi:hypothetical protein